MTTDSKAPYLENEVISANFVLNSQPSSPAEVTGNLPVGLIDSPALRELLSCEIPFPRLAIELLVLHQLPLLLEILGNIALSFFQLDFIRWRAVLPFFACVNISQPKLAAAPRQSAQVSSAAPRSKIPLSIEPLATKSSARQHFSARPSSCKLVVSTSVLFRVSASVRSILVLPPLFVASTTQILPETSKTLSRHQEEIVCIFRRSNLRSNEMDVQESNCSLTPFHRDRGNILRRRTTQMDGSSRFMRPGH